MAEEKVYVCAQCPFGCVLKVALDDQGEIESITGNTCERGYEYARCMALGLEPPASSKASAADAASATGATDDAAAKPARPARYSAYRKRKR